MDIECLRALNALAGYKTMAAAADALHLSPSAVSQQLSRLQRAVGQELLVKSGRGVRLTDAGDVLAGHARDVLARLDQARAELEASVQEVRGDIAVGAFATAARGIVVGAVVALSRYPDLTVASHEIEPDCGLLQLQRGDLDVLVLNDWDSRPLSWPPGIEHIMLGVDLFDVVVPCDHPVARRCETSLRDLGPEPWIAWPAGTVCHRWLVTALRSYGFQPGIAHTAEDHATQLVLVRARLGVAVLPRLGRPDLGADLVAVELVPALVRRVHVAWRAAVSARPAVQATVQALKIASARGLVELPISRRGSTKR